MQCYRDSGSSTCVDELWMYKWDAREACGGERDASRLIKVGGLGLGEAAAPKVSELAAKQRTPGK